MSRVGELVNLDETALDLPSISVIAGPLFPRSGRRVASQLAASPRLSRQFRRVNPASPVSAVGPGELCPRKGGGAGGGWRRWRSRRGVASQTGLWLPASKFPAGAFCMSKLESTPSTCSRSCSNTSRSLFLRRQPGRCCSSSLRTDMR